MDPAVGVHHVPWYIINDTVNGVPDVLPTGHQQAGSDQDHEGGLNSGHRGVEQYLKWKPYLVMQPKYCIVYAYFVQVDQTLHRSKQIQHDSVTF